MSCHRQVSSNTVPSQNAQLAHPSCRRAAASQARLSALIHRPQRAVQAVAAEELAFWDVVEYQQQPNTGQPGMPARVRLGLVQQVGSDAVQLSPLIEEDEGVWVPEAEDAEQLDQQQQVALDRVLRIVETAYGQRQDKEHNPHGEHAHDVWQVLVPLSPGVLKSPQ